MTQPLLSILIPTVCDREDQFNKLVLAICGYAKKAFGVGLDRGGILGVKEGDPGFAFMVPYDNPLIECMFLRDDKRLTIGEKRELLYKAANGLYSWQIDDDDEIADNAIQLILEAIKNNPEIDCITFEEHIDIDGKIQRSNHSLKYDDWENNFDGFDYVRTPFFKSVIKTEIARNVPIPHIRFGEDHKWAQALKPHLKTEIHIPEQLYRYIHKSSNPSERYGLDREA